MSGDEYLIIWLKSGDEGAIKHIFDLYYEPMCLYATSMVKDHAKAQEIVNDIFVNVWLKAKTIIIQTSIKAYLFRSVHNNCLNHIRDQKRKKLAAENYIYHDPEILNPVTYEYPLSNIISQEIRKKTKEVLESLPPQCKKIFELSRFENLTYNQISKKLKISQSTVKTQMSRAFQKFKEEFIEYISLAILMLINF